MHISSNQVEREKKKKKKKKKRKFEAIQNQFIKIINF